MGALVEAIRHDFEIACLHPFCLALYLIKSALLSSIYSCPGNLEGTCSFEQVGVGILDGD